MCYSHAHPARLNGAATAVDLKSQARNVAECTEPSMNGADVTYNEDLGEIIPWHIRFV